MIYFYRTKGGVNLEAGYGILAPNFGFFVLMTWKIDIVEGFDAALKGPYHLNKYFDIWKISPPWTLYTRWKIQILTLFTFKLDD